MRHQNLVILRLLRSRLLIKVLLTSIDLSLKHKNLLLEHLLVGTKLLNHALDLVVLVLQMSDLIGLRAILVLVGHLYKHLLQLSCY